MDEMVGASSRHPGIGINPVSRRHPSDTPNLALRRRKADLHATANHTLRRLREPVTFHPHVLHLHSPISPHRVEEWSLFVPSSSGWLVPG